MDEHTLMVIRNLRRLAVPSHNHEYPLCSQLQQNLPKQELIYLAALFHDIAKGRGGNHSELGQEELISEKQAEARQGLIAQGYSQERLEQLWQSYNPEYFLTHSVNAICSQSRLILDTPKRELPLIAIRQDIQATSLFMEILRQPEGITEQLRRMNRYGVLAAYIPAF
ncbi:hypothetical protein QQ73_10615, partial [Candidatus Endoriftia persephone str. Guaymas]|nr:hypothetical protein [Candidatus Endoriftia persephone str. Guaymas]